MDIVSEFGDNQGFTVKLTSDKIFISAVGNEETLALRGVNGVGVYDDLEKYNEELEEFKKKTMSPKTRKYLSYTVYGFGVLTCLVGISSGDNPGSLIFGLLFFGGIGFAISKFKSKKKPPSLDSYFRIMLSGGDRKFKFDKSGDNAQNIAQFINKVEETLTAYNKA
ncbi:hypothetical protein N9572_01915 [Flavobacteriaceae bacterium]|nr:hypothetical protein [Flavobacteriaceae bacterium]